MKTVFKQRSEQQEGGLVAFGNSKGSACLAEQKKTNVLLAFLLSLALLFAGVGIPLGGYAFADENSQNLAPGTYTVTANLAMPGAYNPVLSGVTVYTNSPNNPFGPTYDENDKTTVSPSVPNAAESLNAQLIVGEDGSKTLYLPIKNPIFTTQDLGTCDSLNNVKFERVAPTHKLENTGSQEGSYGSKDSRIHKMTATLTDTATSGTATYNFKDSVLYAVPLDKEIAPAGDIALQLTVNYDTVKKASDSTEIPSLETEKIVVNVPDMVTLPYTASDNSQVTTIGYETAAMSIEDDGWSVTVTDGKATVTGRDNYTMTCSLTDTDKYVWSDGTTEKKEIKYAVGTADNVSSVKRTYNGETQEFPSDLFNGVESFTGDLSAKDAGEYSITAKLKEGFQWFDKTTEDKTKTWTIQPKQAYPQSTTTIKEGQTPDLYASLNYVSGQGDNSSAFVAGETAETAIDVAPTPSIQFPEGITKAEDLPAGTYSVYWAGGSAKNYTWSTIGSINNMMAPSTLTVEAADEIAVPSAIAGLTYTGAEQQGVAENDAYTLSGEYSAKNAGIYTAKVTPNAGYKWEDGTRDTKEVTWTISKAPLTVTYKGGTMTYGDSVLEQNIEYSGFVGGEDKTTAAGFVASTVAAPTGVEVNGEYSVTPQGGSADNYEFNYVSGMVKVLPVGQAAIPEGTSNVYNGTNQVGVPESVAYTVSGDVSAANCGQYSVTLTLNPGYTWEDGTTGDKVISWSIEKKTLTATYVDEEVLYGETPALVVTVSGFANGETAETADGFVAPVVTAATPMLPGSTQTLTPAGGAATNYAFDYVSGTLTINPLGEIDVPVAAADLIYNGNEQSAFSDVAVQNEETIPGNHYVLSGETSGTNAGTYHAVAQLEEGYVWKDGTAANKEIAWTISKAKLTAQYLGQTMDAKGTFEGKVLVEGFVNGETEQSADSYVAPTVEQPETLEPGKSYELYPKNGSAANYEFDYQSGTLTITGQADNAGGVKGDSNNGNPTKETTTTTTTTTAATASTSSAKTGDSNGIIGAVALSLAVIAGCGAIGIYARKRSK